MFGHPVEVCFGALLLFAEDPQGSERALWERRFHCSSLGFHGKWVWWYMMRRPIYTKQWQFPFSKKIYYLFLFYFWLHRVLVVAREIFLEACRLSVAAHGFSLVATCRFSLPQLWHAGSRLRGLCSSGTGFRVRGLCSLRHRGSLVEAPELSSCGAQAQLPCGHVGMLVPWPVIEPASSALEGRLFTTGPPGKSDNLPFKIYGTLFHINHLMFYTYSLVFMSSRSGNDAFVFTFSISKMFLRRKNTSKVAFVVSV